MSGEEQPQKRINQWFIRGIGVVVACIFLTVMAFTLLDLQQGLFFTEGPLAEGLDSILLLRQIGQYIWTFRVLDLLLVVIILVLIIISTYYLMNFKAQEIRRNQERGMYRQ
jgi:flagellar biosynthesis protein FlhB